MPVLAPTAPVDRHRSGRAIDVRQEGTDGGAPRPPPIPPRRGGTGARSLGPALLSVLAVVAVVVVTLHITAGDLQEAEADRADARANELVMNGARIVTSDQDPGPT